MIFCHCFFFKWPTKLLVTFLMQVSFQTKNHLHILLTLSKILQWTHFWVNYIIGHSSLFDFNWMNVSRITLTLGQIPQLKFWVNYIICQLSIEWMMIIKITVNNFFKNVGSKSFRNFGLPERTRVTLRLLDIIIVFRISLFLFFLFFI